MEKHNHHVAYIAIHVMVEILKSRDVHMMIELLKG